MIHVKLSVSTSFCPFAVHTVSCNLEDMDHRQVRSKANNKRLHMLLLRNSKLACSTSGTNGRACKISVEISEIVSSYFDIC